MRRERAGEPVEQPCRSALAIAVSSVVAILYVTLFPFDFVNNGKSLIEAARDFSLILSQPWVLNDVPRNVVLFVPFGFGLSGLLGPRHRTGWSAPVIVTTAGLLLSATVELVQASTLLRFPSLADILANGIGTALGWGLFHYAGRRMLDTAAVGRQRLDRILTRRRRAFLALTPMLAMLLVTLGLRDTTQMSNWDESFPLILGNERTGDRAWSGTLANVYLADRAFSPEETTRVVRGVSPAAIDADAAVLQYDFANRGETPPGLVSRGAEHEAYSGSGVDLGPTHWLESAGPVSAVSRALAASGEFTLSLEAATSDPDQSGPARLFSISDGAFDRNLTIAQEGSDLVVRASSPFTGSNGRSPEFLVPNVFADVDTHLIVLTYDASMLRLTVDDAANDHAIELLPGVATLMRFFPDDVGQIRITGRGLVVLRVVYRAIMFLPWAAWLAADRRSAASTSRATTPARASGAAWLLAAVLPVPIAEVMLATVIPGYGFELALVVLGSSIAVLGYVAVRLSRLRRS